MCHTFLPATVALCLFSGYRSIDLCLIFLGDWGPRAMNLQLFQQMVELNRSFDQVVAALQRLQSVPFFQRDLIRHALSDVEIALIYANREFFDNFEQIVEGDARWAYRFQRNFSEKLKDRDDIYL
jgi:hypothetical protein